MQLFKLKYLQEDHRNFIVSVSEYISSSVQIRLEKEEKNSILSKEVNRNK